MAIILMMTIATLMVFVSGTSLLHPKSSKGKTNISRRQDLKVFNDRA